MSISSSLSNISVSLHGQEVNVEAAIDEVVRNLQKHLNDLQSLMRAIAMSGEQCTGEDDMQDLKDSCKQVRELQIHILEMNNLFEDLFDMSGQLRYQPLNDEEKAYLKKDKLEAKEEHSKLKKKWTDERKQFKVAQKEQSKLTAIKE